MYAPSAGFSCFLNCVQNPALKLLPDWEFFEGIVFWGKVVMSFSKKFCEAEFF